MPRFKRKQGTGFYHEGYLAHQIEGVKKFEHVRIVEAILNRELKDDECVHHVDENRGNNSNDNLVVCPSKAYHNLIHRRMDAFAACGHYDWRKCRFCKQWDDPTNLRISPNHNSTIATHPACQRAYYHSRKQ